MSSAHAVVIGIETYQQAGIAGVEFARADATAFRDLLVRRLEVPDENALLWLDQDANRTRLEEELRYHVRQLEPDDKFYFFYAGHGLFANGSNRLTAWDTYPLNLPGTTVDLDAVLLRPVRESGCKHSALFLDACAADLSEGVPSRDLVSDMDKRQFAEFIDKNDYTAAFFSCSPREKSYSSKTLKHGIWTHHLLRALGGEERSAIVKGEWITGGSLQDYLKFAVPKFIRERTQIGGRQRPYALIGSNGTFPLARIPAPTAPADGPYVTPDFAKAYFAGAETRSFKSLPGFTWKKKHSVPVAQSDSADAWARRLLSDEVAEEVQTVYATAKDVLKLKSRDIDKQEDVGAGSVDTEFFRFAIEAGQSTKDPGNAVVRREIRLRVPHAELPEDFDAIFPKRVDKLVLPLPGSKGQFKQLIDAIEDAAEKIGAEVEEDPTKGTIDLRLSDGTMLALNTEREIMTVSGAGTDGCLAMIEHIRGGDIKRVMGVPPRLIGGPDSTLFVTNE